MNTKNIVLDIDNTLLHSVNKNDPKLLNNSNFDFEDEQYVYFKRPYVDQLLEHVFNKYNVGIFTAANQEYAEFIVESVFKNYKDKLCFVLSKRDYEKCKFSTGGIKDLCYVQSLHPSFDPEETIIIDDCHGVKSTNNKQCIKVKYFTFDLKSTDTELLSVIKKL